MRWNTGDVAFMICSSCVGYLAGGTRGCVIGLAVSSGMLFACALFIALNKDEP
ncbi:hypothetical protein BURC_03718 [Burkholderiaceae bacterium]|nr:hypothetical protein BURC_03718 [Burkholderiaceae bacterium]